ncbi:hypothetical protein ACFX15_045483 [Malus domestica]
MPIQQRLDRGLATMGWNNLDLDTKIRHVVLERSDNALLFLSMEKAMAWKGRKFSYDAHWSKLQECRDLVADDWKDRFGGSHTFRFCEKNENPQKEIKGLLPYVMLSIRSLLRYLLID